MDNQYIIINAHVKFNLNSQKVSWYNGDIKESVKLRVIGLFIYLYN